MEKLFFRKIELWVVAVLAVLGVLAMIVFGSVVLFTVQGGKKFGALGQAAVALAAVPNTLTQAGWEPKNMQAYDQTRFPGQFGWAAAPDRPLSPPPGYILLSHYNIALQRSLVDLVDLSDFSTVHTWSPLSDKLYAGAVDQPAYNSQGKFEPRRVRFIHPYLMENGDLLVKDHGFPMARINPCGERVWMYSAQATHHATERAPNGNFWTPVQVNPTAIPGVGPDFLDHGIMEFTPDGKVVQETSLTQMMLDNGMRPLVFAVGRYHDDKIHLNDIQPVPGDGPYWKTGDLFVSLRELSTVMLIRPSTGKVLWSKTGPWMYQHDVDVLDDHRIGVFNNNNNPMALGFEVQGNNEVLVYDFATDQVTSPWRDAFIKSDIRTIEGGSFTLTPTGAMMVDEDNYGRIVFLGPDGREQFSYVNRNPDGNIYRNGWSRYVTQADGDAARAVLAAVTCPPP